MNGDRTPDDVTLGEIHRDLKEHIRQAAHDRDIDRAQIADLAAKIDRIPSQREFELSQNTQDQAIAAVASEISTVRAWVKGVVLAMLGGAFTLTATAVLLSAPGGS